MRKLDKLVFNSFLGPFILTFLVVVFILLSTQILRYLDEIFGKDIGLDVLGQFIFHFSVFQTPVAFPLSVMLASLITFGNLGEHSELTAVKSAGISLTRVLLPIFFFVVILCGFSFYSNSNLVPDSALKAYSLLYDIRQKKPTLDIKEGVFYGGIDNFRIKVDKKYEDGQSLKGLVIYDHSKGLGNTDVILADSGQMYTIMNDRYLKFELFDGNFYSEEVSQNRLSKLDDIEPFMRTNFKHSEMVFDLSIFDMKRTKEELFSSNRLMRGFNQLEYDIDSLQKEIYDNQYSLFTTIEKYFPYYDEDRNHVEIPEKVLVFGLLRDSISSVADSVDRSNISNLHKYINLKTIEEKSKDKREIQRLDSLSEKEWKEGQTIITQRGRAKPVKELKKIDVQAKVAALSPNEIAQIGSLVARHYDENNKLGDVYKSATSLTRQAKSKASVSKNREISLSRHFNIFSIQYHKMMSMAFACMTMFLIGAPLGAIIKKGGLGFPVLVSIIFFIIYYVIGLAAEKQARQGIIDPLIAAWMPNIILLPIGLFSLKQARKDARLFETDYYLVLVDRISKWFGSKKAEVKKAD